MFLMSSRQPTKRGLEAETELRNAATARLVRAQLDDLAEARAAGMKLVRRLTDEGSDVPADRAGMAYSRVTRAIRQIVVLEEEILDLRPLPQALNSWGGGAIERTRRKILLDWEQDEAENPRDGDDGRDRGDLSEPDDLHDYNDLPIPEAIDEVLAAIAIEVAKLGPDGDDEDDDPSESGQDKLLRVAHDRAARDTIPTPRPRPAVMRVGWKSEAYSTTPFRLRRMTPSAYPPL